MRAIYEMIEGPCARGCRLFDTYTRKGNYSCLIIEKPAGVHVYWNGDATRGTKRVFATISEALEFMHTRRVKKGWASA